MLHVGQKVRYKLDFPIDVVTGDKLHGRFRVSDIKWSLKPTTIERIVLLPNQPIFYKLKDRKALYSYYQLQPVSDKQKLPPKTILSKFIVHKIIDKRKHKNRIEYLALHR